MLADLHKKAIYNKDELNKVKKCACFYCCEVFDTDEIKEYTDNGQTAICPKCGVDSVIPLSDDEKDEDTCEILDKMYKHYFE